MLLSLFSSALKSVWDLQPLGYHLFRRLPVPLAVPVNTVPAGVKPPLLLFEPEFRLSCRLPDMAG